MAIVAPLWFSLVFGAALGTVLGSFLNVVVYRVPRNLSVVFPPSACPHCDTRIAPYDNVPVLGWILLRGKCRSCSGPISPRYPLVEALTGVLFVVVVLRFGFVWELVPALAFTAAMIAVTLIDFDSMIIPDVITLPGIALGILSSLITPLTLVDSLIGAAAGFALMFGTAWGYEKITGREGLGGGDVKLAAMFGAFLGWQGMLLTVFLASFVGTVIGIGLILRKRGTGRTALPYGVFLAPAAVIVLLWGENIMRAYLSLYP